MITAISKYCTNNIKYHRSLWYLLIKCVVPIDQVNTTYSESIVYLSTEIFVYTVQCTSLQLCCTVVCGECTNNYVPTSIFSTSWQTGGDIIALDRDTKALSET